MGDGCVNNDQLETCFDCVASLKAVIIPPLGVFMKKGCQVEFWVSVGLTILGYVPGAVYSLYIVTDSIRHDPPFFPLDERNGGPPPYPHPSTPSGVKEGKQQ